MKVVCFKWRDVKVGLENMGSGGVERKEMERKGQFSEKKESGISVSVFNSVGRTSNYFSKETLYNGELIAEAVA